MLLRARKMVKSVLSIDGSWLLGAKINHLKFVKITEKKYQNIEYLLWYWADHIDNCSYNLRRLFIKPKINQRLPKQIGLSLNNLYLSSNIWNPAT